MLCRVIRGSGIRGLDSRYLPYVVKDNNTGKFLDIRFLEIGSIITFVNSEFDLGEAHRTCNWPNFITADGVLGTVEYQKHMIHPSLPIWVEELTEENCLYA